MDEKLKKVRKFGLWLIVIFAAVFALVTTIMYMMVQPLAGGAGIGAIGQAIASSWLIYLITAVILLAAYFIYRAIVLKK